MSADTPWGINDQPHPYGDECVACGMQGWNPAAQKTLSNGAAVTVSEGYGAFEGYLLIADGHLVDHEVYTPEGTFRSSTVARRVEKASDITFAND